MPDAPLLSVIIVAYKSRDEIRACLESLPRELRFSNGSGGAVEVVVVDNASDDGTGEIIRGDFPRVRYVPAKENLGFGRANNLGYAQSDPASEFVLFLNPDTICNESALEHCVRRLREDSMIGLISPKLVLADGSMDLACRRSIPTLWDGFCRAIGLAAGFPRVKCFSGYNLTYLPEHGTYDVGAINGAFMLGKRSVFDAVASSKLQALSSKLRTDPPELTAESLPPTAASEAKPVESAEFSVERGEAESRAESGSGLVEGEELRVERQQLSADRLPLKAAREASPVESSGLRVERGDSKPRAESEQLNADRLSLIVPRAQHAGVFDERFFMYGDDLDLCIRVRKAGYRIVYDGSVSITHLKGLSVAKDLNSMRAAIFDANRDVFLKHFNPNGSVVTEWKYRATFGLWKKVARWRAALRGDRRVRPL